jgi:hypothetical protein
VWDVHITLSITKGLCEVGASSVCGRALFQLQGSLPFVFVLGKAVQPFAKKASLARTAGLSFERHIAHLWQGRSGAGVLALSRRVQQAPGQWVVGASRRLKSQQLGAAMNGSARSASFLRAKYITQENARVSRLARSEAVPSAMPNYSIERTLSGLRPPSASHVKR